MENLEGSKKIIKEILDKEYFFRVPEYQRPYSWDSDNFEELISDLLETDHNQEYFLGTIVLHHKKQEEIYDIVDGQQRMTTLMILFACLRDKIEDDSYKQNIQNKIKQTENKVDGIPEKIRIEVRDKQIFRELISEINGTTIEKDIKHLPEPEWRYVKAIEIFNSHLSNLNQAELEKFSQFLSQKCIIIYLATTTFDDAFKLFTIVNDRGKQLRRIDVLKAQNISPKVISSESVRLSLAQKWEEKEKLVGEDDFERVVNNLRFIILEEKPYKDLLFEFEEKIFKKGKLNSGQPFIDKVCEYTEIYNKLFNDFDFFNNSTNEIKINNLLYIMNSEFVSYEWRACLMQYVKRFNDDKIEAFLHSLEMLYLDGIIKGVTKDTRTSAFGKLMNVINSASNANEIVSSSIMRVDKDRLKTELRNNIYGRTFTKYILLRLELITSEQDIEHKFSAKSVEHVLPQTIKDDSIWRTWYTDEQHEEWIHKLANLVLLSKSKNSKSSNKEFRDKKDNYLSSRVSDYPCSIKVLEYSEWKPMNLTVRQDELIEKVLDSTFN